MARQPRIEAPGTFLHVVTRGNNRQVVFDDAVRRFALGKLAEVARRNDWSVFAWAFMSNHFHLVLQLGDSGLSAGMQRLNHSLACVSNARFGRINHCFGQRFWSTALETDTHLLASIRYTLWNPSRAGVTTHPRRSRWTSYRASAGLDLPHDALALPALMPHFGRTPATARRAFARFIEDGRERCVAPWDEGAGILT